MNPSQAHSLSLSGEAVIVAVVVALGAVAMISVIVAGRRERRRMDELWAAAGEADRQFYAALYAYLTAPRPKSQPESAAEITVELEVIKPDKTGEKEEKGKT